MENTEKLELNKKIRKYAGTNGFILSLKKNLASKYPEKITIGNKEYKVLTEKQYDIAKSILD